MIIIVGGAAQSGQFWTDPYVMYRNWNKLSAMDMNVQEVYKQTHAMYISHQSLDMDVWDKEAELI